jgi:hypothetical protein
MKPHSLATIFFRFIALFLIVSGISSSLGPLILSVVFAPATGSSATFGAASIQMNSPFAGMIGIQLAIAAVFIVGGILLYVWSLPLGKLIARGLE